MTEKPTINITFDRDGACEPETEIRVVQEGEEPIVVSGSPEDGSDPSVAFASWSFTVEREETE